MRALICDCDTRLQEVLFISDHCYIESTPLPRLILQPLCYEIVSCSSKVNPIQSSKILQRFNPSWAFFSLYLLAKETNSTRTETSFSNFVCDLTSWAHSRVYFLPSQNANIWRSCHWKPRADDNIESKQIFAEQFHSNSKVRLKGCVKSHPDVRESLNLWGELISSLRFFFRRAKLVSMPNTAGKI